MHVAYGTVCICVGSIHQNSCQEDTVYSLNFLHKLLSYVRAGTVAVMVIMARLCFSAQRTNSVQDKNECDCENS